MPDGKVLLPTEVQGWTAEDEGQRYDAETLYDYINGSAEVYRAFNVVEVVARRYVKEGAPEIIADVFDMGSSEDAFGAYHHDIRDGASADIGVESESMPGSLAFWKGRHFVSIFAYEETDASRRAIVELGQRIAGVLPGSGGPPDILRLLPQAGLIQSHINYFHTHDYLNVHFFLSVENLLELDRNTEGILARYLPVTGPDAGGTTPYVVVLVRYPSVAAADRAYRRFREAYMPDAEPDGTVRTEEGAWTGAWRWDDILVAVFDAPSKQEARRIADDANANIGGQKP